MEIGHTRRTIVEDPAKTGRSGRELFCGDALKNRQAGVRACEGIDLAPDHPSRDLGTMSGVPQVLLGESPTGERGRIPMHDSEAHRTDIGPQTTSARCRLGRRRFDAGFIHLNHPWAGTVYGAIMRLPWRSKPKLHERGLPRFVPISDPTHSATP
jgi:hypothetical protein